MPTLPDSGFDKVASFYDRLAQLVFGNTLKNAQLYLLPFIPENSRVLVIGGGSGWFLQQLILSAKPLHILYLDAAPGMLTRAQAKYEALHPNSKSQVSFRLGTEAALLPHEQFDVIITPFLLDLFPKQRLQQIMQKLDIALAPNGLWLFADFWPIRNPAPWWQKALAKSMYSFFGILSGVKARALPDYGAHFRELGFIETASKHFYGGFVQAKVFNRK